MISVNSIKIKEFKNGEENYYLQIDRHERKVFIHSRRWVKTLGTYYFTKENAIKMKKNIEINKHY